eukprot:jgi/Chrzof1/6050/Cz17g03210.t1
MLSSSYLGCTWLRSGRWEDCCTKDDQGRVFLDLDPELFLVVLNWLRMFNVSPMHGGVPEPKIPSGKEESFLVRTFTAGDGSGCNWRVTFIQSYYARALLPAILFSSRDTHLSFVLQQAVVTFCLH